MAMLENLGGFFNSRPPLVVFMVCLASFAITLITLAQVVKSKDLPDPDITEDWNTMLEKFSHLHFCISKTGSSQTNSSLPKLKAGEKGAAETYKNIHDTLNENVIGKSQSGISNDEESSQTSSRHERSIDNRNTDIGIQYFKRDASEGSNVPTSSYRRDAINEIASTIDNVTVHLFFIYIPKKSHFDTSQLVASVTAHQLKLDVSAKVKGEESFKVFLNLPQNLTTNMCEEVEGDSCVQYRIPACVTIQAERHLLPMTLKPNQETCAAYRDPSQRGAYYQMQSGTLAESTKTDWCEDGSQLLPEYTLDDSLTVFLSMHDKSLINMHLMRTSYFLFVMVVTLFCYALIKGRPSKTKLPHVAYDKVPMTAA